MNKTLTLVLVLALTATLCACGGGALEVEPPQPPATMTEPRVLERVVDATRDVREAPGSADAWGRLGEVYDVNSLPDQALPCYARAAELDPGQWRWPYFRGLLLRGSDPAGALDQFTRAAGLRPDHAPLQFHLGFAHYLAEQFDPAERHFARALELDPQLVNARLGLARIALARGEPDEALAILEQAEREVPDEGAVQVQLAQVYHELERVEDARRAEQRTASVSRPALPDGLAALADSVRDEVKKRESVGSDRQIQEAQRFLLLGREDEATQALEKALESDPASVTALIWSARLLMKRGELDPARERLERALAADPTSADAQVELGAVHALAGSFDTAIFSLERALEIDPTRYAVKSKLAGLLFQSGRSEEALELLREAGRDLPDDPGIQRRLATVLIGLGRIEEAVPALQRAVGADRANVQTRLDLGQALWQLGRYGEAIRLFREGVALEPTASKLNHKLAWSLATCPEDELRDGAAALIVARSLCEATGFNNPEFLDGLAAAQAETGDFDGAAETVRRALQIVQRAFDNRAAGLDPAAREQFEMVLQQLGGRLQRYERDLPYRDSGGAG